MPDNNTTYIVSAFVITWVALLGYVVHLRRVRAEAARRLHHAAEDLSGGQS